MYIEEHIENTTNFVDLTKLDFEYKKRTAVEYSLECYVSIIFEIILFFNMNLMD